MNKYTQDGVNVIVGDDISKIAGKVCKATYGNSPYVNIIDSSSGHFRGPRAFELVNLPDGVQHYLAPDGIGTKVVIIDAATSYLTAAQDLFAMTCTDMSRYGGLPLVFTSVLDVKSLGNKDDLTNKAFQEMFAGLLNVARANNIVCLNGETAELGSCISSENPNARAAFNWAGVVYGVFHPDRMVTGETLEAGQCIIALREHGFRSNGISSVRKALSLKFGENWFDKDNNSLCRQAVEAAAKPSILYDQFLADINGWNENEHYIKAHALAHISGGGIPSKLFEDLLKPRGLSAHLTHLWEPPQIMRDCAAWRGMTDTEIYETWNGGQGLLAVIDTDNAYQFIQRANKYGIEAQICGMVRETLLTPELIIHSKFNEETVKFT